MNLIIVFPSLSTSSATIVEEAEGRINLLLYPLTHSSVFGLRKHCRYVATPMKQRLLVWPGIDHIV